MILVVAEFTPPKLEYQLIFSRRDKIKQFI